MQRSMSSRFLWSDDRHHHHHNHRGHDHEPSSCFIDIENPPERLPATARRRQRCRRVMIPFLALPANLLSTLTKSASALLSYVAQCTSIRHLYILLLCALVYFFSSTVAGALFALAVLFLVCILFKTASRTNLFQPFRSIRRRRSIFLDLEEQLVARRSIVGNLGVELHQDGTHYAGEYRNGARTGRGRIVIPGKYSYGGDWGSSQGYGVENFLTTGAVYKGHFLQTLRDGYGRVQHSNGEEYVGEWKNGIRQGVGRQKYVDGSTYEGEFCQDKKHGVGAYYHSNGSTYRGQYFHGMIAGVGIYHCISDETYTYEGSWHDNQMQGYGVSLQKDNPVPISGNWVQGSIKTEHYIPVSDPRIKNAVQGAREAARKCAHLGLREVESQVFKAIAEANNADRAARLASTNAHYISKLHPLHPRRLMVTASAESLKALRALGNSGRGAAQTLARLMADWFG